VRRRWPSCHAATPNTPLWQASRTPCEQQGGAGRQLYTAIVAGSFQSIDNVTVAMISQCRIITMKGIAAGMQNTG
jgi:hypothetical protein